MAVLSVVPVLGWGYNYYGQATAPAAATNLVALGAGSQHALALRADGSLVTWGYNGYGLGSIPAAEVNIVAMAVGDYHDLVLRADGTVLAWGKNDAGESVVPANLTNVIALAGGYSHSLALRADGTVIAWGDNSVGQLNVPAAATNVVAIAAGMYHSVALKADGSVVAWGLDQDGESDVPASATNVVAISAGAMHSLALKADGTLVTWGNGTFGATTIPTNATNVTAISSGGWDNLAVLQDGTVTGWGYNSDGQSSPPASVTNPAAIFAGGEFSMAWLSDPTTGVSPRFWQQPVDRSVAGGDTIFLYPGLNGTPPLSCQWYFNNSPLAGQTNRWLALPNANPTETGGYSVVVTNGFGAVTSVVATLTVQALRIIVQPTNVSAHMGSSVTLAVTVAGTAPLSYQWQKDGQDLSDTNRVTGSASPTLALTGIQPGDSGSYRLVVTNAYAAVTSDVAVLTVLLPAPLLNVDFGGGTQSLKTGPAAIGQTTADYWNYYTAGSPGVTNLAFADGSLTGVGVVVSNAPSPASNGSSDPMLNDMIYQGTYGGFFTVSLLGLPPGSYEFYFYTMWGSYYPLLGADFQLLVNGVSQGDSDLYGFGPDAPPWIEGVQHAPSTTSSSRRRADDRGRGAGELQ